MKPNNFVQLIGHLGKDPELSYTGKGHAVCKFSLATSERWKDASGEKQERTDWHNIVAWEKVAELCGSSLKKGSKILVIGKITSRSWDDKTSGQKRWITEIVIDTIYFLDKKGDESPSPGSASAPEISAPPPEKDDLPF